ncbi:cobalamin biosynthesis protein CobW [Nocardiopsis sp. TSRI0078]|uniref:CobW family GTP-binding protein n=1 Tax=unclassified Nocardiopsis TaxID=2649073 RepID=UPI0009398A6F|nr:GTP-binding protein [Nocardiopsis sp. TSRI0078]OKI19165.1 cobalamin biosynthesis protein CobW [Nocardiopsis sp. TSRI0078]
MPVAVVCGLHRRARGRTADDLLEEVPGSLAVHHDLGGIGAGVVHRVTRDRWGTVDHDRVRADHPCASCALREDLVPALVRLAERGEHTLCVVETWDGVEPRRIAEAVAAQDALRLATVVAAVDTERLLPDLSGHDDLHDRGLGIAPEDGRTVAEVLSHQVEYPTAVVLHGSRHLDEARALVEHLNPAAAVVAAAGGLADPTHGRFDTGAAARRLDPAWAHYAERADGRVSTLTWTRRRPLHPVRLHESLERIVSSGLRGRGRIWLANRPDTLLVWNAHNDALLLENGGPWLDALPGAAVEMVCETRRLSALMDWDPVVGDRRQHLAFTGVDLDAERLVALLDSCLMNEDEAGLPLLSDPFAGAL